MTKPCQMILMTLTLKQVWTSSVQIICIVGAVIVIIGFSVCRIVLVFIIICRIPARSLRTCSVMVIHG